MGWMDAEEKFPDEHVLVINPVCDIERTERVYGDQFRVDFCVRRTIDRHCASDKDVE